MNCDTVKDRLAEHSTGDLPHELGRDLQQHLAGCVTCQREVEQQKAVLEKIKGFFSGFDPVLPTATAKDPLSRENPLAGVSGGPTQLSKPKGAGVTGKVPVGPPVIGSESDFRPEMSPRPSSEGLGRRVISQILGRRRFAAMAAILAVIVGGFVIYLYRWSPWGAPSLERPSPGPVLLLGHLATKSVGRLLTAMANLTFGTEYETRQFAVVSHPAIATATFSNGTSFTPDPDGFLLANGLGRFEKGPSARPFRVQTPTATIGVRGTAFDVLVTVAGTVIFLSHGSARVQAKSETHELGPGDLLLLPAREKAICKANAAPTWQTFLALPSDRQNMNFLHPVDTPLVSPTAPPPVDAKPSEPATDVATHELPESDVTQNGTIPKNVASAASEVTTGPATFTNPAGVNPQDAIDQTE